MSKYTEIMKKQDEARARPGESIKDWSERWETVYGRALKKREFNQIDTERFPMVNIRDLDAKDGANQSARIQRAITMLNQIFPDSRDFLWNGNMQFWFSSIEDAITFKLHWSN